jgi:hypothetical protein
LQAFLFLHSIELYVLAYFQGAVAATVSEGVINDRAMLYIF